MDQPFTGSPTPSPGLVIPWAWLSVILGVLAIGALGTLSVVVTVNNVDTLSTIALALAVIAFAAQLIVSLAQGMAGAQQLAQVERVNVDTQSALSALRATSDALLTTQREQFGVVLSAALERAVPEAVEETLSAAEHGGNEGLPDQSQNLELQEAILSRVDELLRTRASSLAPQSSPRPAKPEPSPRYHILNTYPDAGHGRELAKVMKALTSWEAQAFSKEVTRAKNLASTGRDTGRWIKLREGGHKLGVATKALNDKGLYRIEERHDDKHPASEYRWLDLTDLGVRLGSLIVAAGAVPDWLFDEISGS